jgi:F420-0:gamma-glutamyl ligase
LALTALSAIGASACSDNSNTTTGLTATTITANAATNAQTGVVGTALAQPVAVIVADQNGAPLANATVNWAVTAGGGSVASSTSVTDANGNATVVWTLGTAV